MSIFDPNDDIDKGIYEVNGAGDELSKLVDWINSSDVTELSLREYVNERLSVNMKRATELKIQNQLKLEEFEKKNK